MPLPSFALMLRFITLMTVNFLGSDNGWVFGNSNLFDELARWFIRRLCCMSRRAHSLLTIEPFSVIFVWFCIKIKNLRIRKQLILRACKFGLSMTDNYFALWNELSKGWLAILQLGRCANIWSVWNCILYISIPGLTSLSRVVRKRSKMPLYAPTTVKKQTCVQLQYQMIYVPYENIQPLNYDILQGCKWYFGLALQRIIQE